MRVLEVLRQPLEDKIVTISRAKGSFSFPANFMLVAAMNPCPCGYYGDPVKECTCTSAMVTRYQKRISGPLLDRIDIHTEVPRVDFDKLADDRLGEDSEAIRVRVEAARERQRDRFVDTELASNADMGPGEIRQYCVLDSVGKTLVRQAMSQLQLSARAFRPTTSCRSAAISAKTLVIMFTLRTVFRLPDYSDHLLATLIQNFQRFSLIP
jgi:magnesium chelatase family protein